MQCEDKSIFYLQLSFYLYPMQPSITTSRIRSVIGGSLGNLVEWYDWYAYTAFSLYFSGAFFTSKDPVVQLLNTSGIFAIGFLMRPIGGWLMGSYADKKGRKKALTLSVMMMSVGSLMITVVPGYNQCHLPERSSRKKTPRLLFQLPVRNAHHGTIDRSGCFSDLAADFPDRKTIA
jgi:MFS family permease